VKGKAVKKMEEFSFLSSTSSGANRIAELEAKLQATEMELKPLKSSSTKTEQELLLEEYVQVEENIKLKELELDELKKRKEELDELTQKEKLGTMLQKPQPNKNPKSVTLDLANITIRSGWLWIKIHGDCLPTNTWKKKYFKFDMVRIVTVYYFSRQMPDVTPQLVEETKDNYLKRKRDFSNQQKRYAAGYFGLMNASIVMPSEKRTHRNANINPKFQFDIVVPNSPTIHLCACSQEEFNMWVQSIQYVTSTIQSSRAAIAAERDNTYDNFDMISRT
jgi:hypothetical protein